MSKTKGIGGSIHRIREFELEKVSLADEFDILQIVGEGWFGKILLVEHKATDTEMVLKALPKPYTALRDFYREFHYGLHLGAHKNIISTYDVSFETAGFYVFSQEYAPLGDLTSNVQDTGIGELHTKRVAKQLASALEHLHTRDLVHRDVKLDNILVFKSDFSRIKLCDFGETRRVGSLVPRRNEWLPYAPPEVLRVKPDNDYTAVTSHDVWQFGIVIFVCLTGCLPWQKAALDDPRYQRYLTWHLSTMKLGRQPKLFKLISSKGQRIFKKYLEPRTEKRPHGLAELSRFIDDRWLSKVGIEKNNEVPDEEEGLCPSMYSFHSSPEEKNKLLYSLTQYGLETTVDRCAKKDRIRDWIQSSVIEEEDEEEYEDEEVDTDEDIQIKDHRTGPAGEIGNRGPIGERKISNGHVTLERKVSRRNSTVSIRKMPEVYSPPIDPRIPLEQQQDKIKLQVEEMRQNKAIQPVIKSVVKSNSLDESDGGNSSMYTSNESSASNVNFEHFGLQNALPFQNIKVNQSNNSLDSDSSIKHKINIQEPQAQQYTIPVKAQENFAQKREYPAPTEYPIQTNQIQYSIQPTNYPAESRTNDVQARKHITQPREYPSQPQVYPSQYPPQQLREYPPQPREYLAQPKEYPSQLQEHPQFPSQLREYPAQPKEYPAQTKEYPAQPREYLIQNKEYPAQPREYPAQPREYSAQPREYPAQPREYPAQAKEYPAQPREYPSQPREYTAQSHAPPREYQPQQPREHTTQPHEYPKPPKPQEDPKIQEYHKHPTAPHRNGHTRSKYERKPTSPIPPKRSVREDKRFGAYGHYGSKSSSSNSNNSTEKTNK